MTTGKTTYKKTKLMEFAPLKMLKLRESRGLTQPALGDLLGIRKQSVAQLEKGDNLPAFGTFCKLASVLGVDHCDLLKQSRKKNKTVMA